MHLDDNGLTLRMSWSLTNFSSQRFVTLKMSSTVDHDMAACRYGRFFCSASILVAGHLLAHIAFKPIKNRFVLARSHAFFKHKLPHEHALLQLS